MSIILLNVYRFLKNKINSFFKRKNEKNMHKPLNKDNIDDYDAHIYF